MPEIAMAPRAYWKGSLKLSLVTCPVALYPASTAAEKTRFHMINRETGNHPYYIVPDGKVGVDAFAVIRDAMKDQERVALARIVLTNREHIIAIEPLGKGLLGTTLRYPYELRDEADYFDDIKSPKVSKDMIELASHILDTKAAHFDPSEFKDEYENALKALVRRKAAGKPVKLPEREERPSNVINLMDALKQSLKGGRGGGGAKRRGHSSARRTTAHRRPARRAHRSSARRRRAS
jgi:DNA end-binding protein Ku